MRPGVSASSILMSSNPYECPVRSMAVPSMFESCPTIAAFIKHFDQSKDERARIISDRSDGIWRMVA